MINKQDKPVRAVIYTRVSKDDSGEGASNERQREACENLASMRGWEVVGLCEDVGVSAFGKKNRPQWQRVLEIVERGDADVIVAWALDRITRNMSDLGKLVLLAEERNVGVATAQGDLDLTTPMGEAIATILAAIARMEVRQKAERQKLAERQRAAQGKVRNSGFRAFGYAMDGTVIESEAKLIRKAVEDVLDGAPLRQVVREWNAEGVRPPRAQDGMWTHRSVRAILLNARNAGRSVYRGRDMGRGEWEPIIDEATYAIVKAKLTDPARKVGGRTGKAPQNLLTGVARCSVCDQPVNAASGHKGAPIYQCAAYHVSTPRAEADQIVRAAFASALALLRPESVLPAPVDHGSADALMGEERQLRERQAEAAQAFARGALSIEQVEAVSKSINAQLAVIEDRLSRAVEATVSPWEARAESVREFDSLPWEKQRDVLARLAEVKLYPRGRGRRNVPIKKQVTVYVRQRTKQGEKLVPALDELRDGRTTA